jgi:hypothetical protein
LNLRLHHYSLIKVPQILRLDFICTVNNFDNKNLFNNVFIELISYANPIVISLWRIDESALIGK